MFAKDLVGKTCVREKPVMKERYIREGGGYGFSLLSPQTERKIEEPDYTYCTESVKIIAASDHNIVIERETIGGKPFQTILDERYCDDSWVDYNDLLNSGLTETNPENNVHEDLDSDNASTESGSAD